MNVDHVPPRRRSRPLSLWIFLGNAIVLACVMLLFGIRHVSKVGLSNDGLQFLQSTPGWGAQRYAHVQPHVQQEGLSFRRPIGTILKPTEFGEIAMSDGSRVRSALNNHSIHRTWNRVESKLREKRKRGVLETKMRSNSSFLTISELELATTNDSVPHPCSNFSGVLHIKSGDRGAAAGTMFFQYVINQLIYAEMYNLMPFIHLDKNSSHVFDDDVHGVGGGLNLTIPCELVVSVQRDETIPDGGSWPGLPRSCENSMKQKKKLWFRGTGVWNHYLEPVSAFDPNHRECQNLPYVTLPYDQLTPGIHVYAPWAVRSWEYRMLPSYLQHNRTQRTGLHDWYLPQRLRGHRIVTKYYRFRSHLQVAAKELVPDGTQCLAVHIRHSDKGGLARTKIPVNSFSPYVDAYIQNGGDKVYLATDSSSVVTSIQALWKSAMLIIQSGIVRSDSFNPVFQRGNHNRTNTEVLVDILAMSRCQFLIHGFSAVSESAFYLNPNLHNRSIDLEDPGHSSASEFGQLVKEELSNVVL